MNRPKNKAFIAMWVGALLVLFSCRGAEQIEGSADLIFINGNIITVDPNQPQAQAIAIQSDRILAVGSNEEINAHRGEQTEIIDLEGKTALPGLIDSHMHFPDLGKRTKQLFLDETKSPQEVIDIVQAVVAKKEPGEWVMGQGWHTATWKTDEYPDNTELSQVSPDNPVYLTGMAIHAAWVNDEALRLAGITKDTPDPPGGKILRHPETGEPTGILLEKATDFLGYDFLPPETRETKKANIRSSVETALKLGLTEVHDAGTDAETIEIYKELLEEGNLKVRLYVMYLVPDGGEILDEYIQTPPEIGLGDHRLTLRSIKAFADGALGARGAALIEPYSDDPETTGMIQNSEDELYKILSKSMKAGYQVCLHAIGDRGNRNVLDAAEKVQAENPGADPRTRIEHAQILTPEDIPRFARLGVIPSMQPVQCTMDIGFAESRVGPERMKSAYAWKSLLESGAIIPASADTPAFPVHFTNPLWGIYAAVTRQTNDGNPPGGWYPEEKVSRMDALKMYTIHGAYAAFEEDLKGSLSPGKLADVTVLSKDILSVPATEILETEVLMTVVGGKVEYKR